MTIMDGEGREESGARAGARDSLLLMARIWDADGVERGQVRVRNLSETGMMADCGFPLKTGSVLTVDLRGIGQVTGEVVRVEESGRIGVHFRRRIDPQRARKPVNS